MEVWKSSRHRSNYSGNVELCHFTLLFCKGWQSNVPRFITHVHSYFFCSLNLSFDDVLLAVVFVVCLTSLISLNFQCFRPIGPLQDPVTWYGINYTGTQITQWDFQNKGKSGWTGKSSFVLEVPLRHLRPSVIYSVPCDRILQRAYC